MTKHVTEAKKARMETAMPLASSVLEEKTTTKRHKTNMVACLLCLPFSLPYMIKSPINLPVYANKNLNLRLWI